MADTTYRLILLRHGESQWNQKNLFTGWVDVDLNEKGEKEAARGGELLAAEGFLPDVLHTSLLRRAIRTSQIALDKADRHWIPVSRSWRLNERHYGALQGKDKAQTLAEFGEEQFQLWRRSYDTPPPVLADDNEYSQGGDARYAEIPSELRPRTECLKDVVDRMLPYWYDAIVPDLAGRQDRPGHRPRQQPARAGQAPRRHLGRGHRGPEHPDRHPAGLRARRRLQAGRQGRPLPRRRRRRGGHRGGQEPGQEVVRTSFGRSGPAPRIRGAGPFRVPRRLGRGRRAPLRGRVADRPSTARVSKWFRPLTLGCPGF